MSDRTQMIFGFLVVLAACGFALPAVFCFWALAWFFGFGAGPSPLWGLVAYAIGLGVLGWLRYGCQRPYLTGAFRGAVVATAFLVASVPVLSHRAAKATAEFQRVIYRYRDAPSSLEILDATNHILWRLRSKGAPISLSLPGPTEVRYGIVPADFVQEVPLSGLPRPFIMGEAIEIRVNDSRQSHTAKGIARGPDRVEQLSIVGRNH